MCGGGGGEWEDGRQYIFPLVVGAESFQIIWVIGVRTNMITWVVGISLWKGKKEYYLPKKREVLLNLAKLSLAIFVYNAIVKIPVKPVLIKTETGDWNNAFYLQVYFVNTPFPSLRKMHS